MTPTRISTLFTAILFAMILLPRLVGAQEERWPQRVLITNDNGIDDIKIQELARAFAKIAETWVVAADRDRSGTSNLMEATRSGEFRVTKRDLGEGIEAYSMDGYPADCVVFALGGPLFERLPDLVVSGINGGANLGDDWFGSGTIGAARTAAYFGLPAIAVSGLNDSDLDAVESAVSWVVELAQSEVVRSLQPTQYLTVGLPHVHPTQISGIEVVARARGTMRGRARRVDQNDDGHETWRIELEPPPVDESAPTDVGAVSRNAIALTPMRAGEADPNQLARLQARSGLLPEWKARKSPNSPRCQSGLGIVFDDAEDETGREWGVLIEEVMAGGKADEMGMKVGDVVIRFNGDSLETPRRSSEDPDDRFLRLLRQLDCGERGQLDVVRNGEALTFEFRIREEP